jgi:FXSXX-COOH protein
MSDKPNVASDVLLDLPGLSLADLSERGDSVLIRALRRFLAADDEADVVAQWNSA